MAPLRYVVNVTRMMLFILIILSAIFLLNHVRLSAYFPIQIVRVYGINHLDRREVCDSLAPLVKRGFFGIQVEAIRDHLLPMPWVEDILVRREWPNIVNVTIIEKQAVAIWNGNMLVSETGNIFEPDKATYPNNLPHFYAPIGKQIIVLQFYNDINRLLLPLHVKISQLEMTSFLSWKLKLDNGITVQAGQKDILQRMAHLVRVYPTIVGVRAGDVDYIDLRYPNGVAVRWKEAIKT